MAEQATKNSVECPSCGRKFPRKVKDGSNDFCPGCGAKIADDGTATSDMAAFEGAVERVLTKHGVIKVKKEDDNGDNGSDW